MPNKKERRKLKQETRRSARKRRWFLFKGFRKLMRKEIIGIVAIVVTLTTSLVVYYLSTATPDIRRVTIVSTGLEDAYLDKATEENVQYLSLVLRFWNYSTKSGYVDKVEPVPSSLSSGLILRVMDVEKIRIGWKEQKDVRIRFIARMPAKEVGRAYLQGKKEINVELKAYDNLGQLIPDLQGMPDTTSIALTLSGPNESP